MSADEGEADERAFPRGYVLPVTMLLCFGLIGARLDDARSSGSSSAIRLPLQAGAAAHDALRLPAHDKSLGGSSDLHPAIPGLDDRALKFIGGAVSGARASPAVAPAGGLNASMILARCEADSLHPPSLNCARAVPCAISEFAISRAECAARKTYDAWPTHDPYLPAMREADARTAAMVERLGSRTMLIAGDSMSGLDFRGLACSIQREGLEDTRLSAALVPKWRAWGKARGLSCCGQMVGTVRQGSIVFVGIYKYEPAVLAFLMRDADVLLLNYGLHYRQLAAAAHGYEAHMGAAFAQVMAHAREAPASGPSGRGVRVLFRETSAQHFKGSGSYTADAERVVNGRCSCAKHAPDAQQNNFVALENAVVHALAGRITAGVVPVVPFYSLTEPRYDMHNMADVRPSICDCTHVCYTPQLYDAYFAGVERALAQADRVADQRARENARTPHGKLI